MKKILKRTKIAILCCTMMISVVHPMYSYGKEDYESYRAVFDPEYYYDQYPDLQASVGQDPEKLFQHFVSTGVREGRSGNEEFNLKAYVFYNEDLLDTYKTDLSGYCRHYLETGRYEGRITTPQENQTNMIGTYHTSYDNTLPRAVNVELAAQRINGVVLQPGQSFSFSNTVLSRIPQNGYVMAPAIGGNEYGGGICQVSSTLYAAMCHALLPATERHPHSSRVSYLPVGMDATISEGYKDLKFVNIYNSPLMIQCTYNEGILTVSLWLGEIQEETKEEIPAEQTEEQAEQTEENEQPKEVGPGVANQPQESNQPEMTPEEQESNQPEMTPEAQEPNQPELTPEEQESNQPELTPESQESNQSEMAPGMQESNQPGQWEMPQDAQESPQNQQESAQ